MRAAAVLALLLLATACGGQDPAGDALPAGCTDDPVASAACGFVQAVQAGDVDGLSEQARLAASEGLPDSSWDLEGCELVGDVTVDCEVAFSSEPEQRVVVTLVPDAEYDGDGGLVLEPGEQAAYDVVDVASAGA